jgi:hypothetical protein
MWMVELPGPPIRDGHPSWVRHRRLPAETEESDVRYFLAERLGNYAAARAVRGGVEIVMTRRLVMVKRMIEETETA